MKKIIPILICPMLLFIVSTNQTNAQNLNCLDTFDNGRLKLSTNAQRKTPPTSLEIGQNALRQKIRNQLKTMGAFCRKNKLYDKNGKPIIFYPDMSCRGRPYSPEEQKAENEKQAKIREKYTIVYMGCYPPRF